MNSLSLINIIKDDVDFGRRINKKVLEIKTNKENLSKIADQYSQKYEKEIVDGTKLLSEGLSRGLTESEIRSKYNGFLPTIQTPLLNFLYFLLRESDGDQYYGNQRYDRRNRIDEYLIKNNQLEHSDSDVSAVEAIDQALDELTREMYKESHSHDQRSQINEKFGQEKDFRPEDEDVKLKETPDMEEYMFGHLTLDQFNTLKKLKSLTFSDNVNEATLAFQKGKELSKQYKVDWNKIPSYYKKK